MTDSKYLPLTNRFAAEMKTRSVPKPFCDCLDAQYYGRGWEELHLHQETQDTSIPAWNRLLQLIDDAAKDQRSKFSIASELSPTDWAQIVTLPASIAKLKHVKHFNIYGSSLVRIPPEIGEMTSLELFEPYTSYLLHWFPYEITRCPKLRDSTVSTRALYGNLKYRPPFPRLPDVIPDAVPKTCSVCDQALSPTSVKQVWISRVVGSDVLPLLVHACSENCIKRIEKHPKRVKRYLKSAHCGGLDLEQPSVETHNTEKRIVQTLSDAKLKDSQKERQAELNWAADCAIEGGFRSLLIQVLDAGLDVAKNSQPLSSAFESRDLDIAELLIERGSPIDLPHDGHTPLMAAASAGFLKGVEFLIASGASVSYSDDESGQTALSSAEAAIRHNEEMIGTMPRLVRDEYRQVITLLRTHLNE